MTCKVCGGDVGNTQLLCPSHEEEWVESPEFKRGLQSSGNVSRVAIFDWVTRVRLERLSGVRT